MCLAKITFNNKMTSLSDEATISTKYLKVVLKEARKLNEKSTRFDIAKSLYEQIVKKKLVRLKGNVDSLKGNT